ncbi:universal stress protein [Nonomuraea sp. NPDC050790]|uniref:universal stress protein n=1 Tax=Nonomuraea sp. NPDC050790 TaxID=3364371 RepID=UPI0037B60666
MIVVGVDGSRAGLEAVGWAAREAALRKLPLMVVHAMPAWAHDSGPNDRYAGVAQWMRDGAATVLAAAAERAEQEAPGLAVERRAVPGDARAALLELSKDADLLVMGSHGMGGFRGLLLGSVAFGVTGHAACDVVIIREPSAATPPRGEVVVGVDGTEASQRVLAYAFEHADRHGLELRAVHAWNRLDLDGVLASASEEDDELRLLKEAVAGYRDLHPDVRVLWEVVHDHPAHALKNASEGADLLVVGTHGQGALSGLILGSVSQAMLHYAKCPLAVVRNVPETR